jgi:hypothetical protein
VCSYTLLSSMAAMPSHHGAKFLLLLLSLIVLICVTEYWDILGQDEVTDPVHYKAVLDWRVSRLKHVCRHHKNQMAAEQSSLYHRQQKLNKCTTSYFIIKGTNHIICNVLKGGSTSWNVFFNENNITATLLADCKPGECSRTPRMRIKRGAIKMSTLNYCAGHISS